MAKKQQGFWVSDGYGRESLHINGPSLTFDQSNLGHIARIDDQWFFVEKGVDKPHGPYDTYPQAKREGMKITGTEYV